MNCPTCGASVESADVTTNKYPDRDLYHVTSYVLRPCGCERVRDGDHD